MTASELTELAARAEAGPVCLVYANNDWGRCSNMEDDEGERYDNGYWWDCQICGQRVWNAYDDDALAAQQQDRQTEGK